MIVDPELGEPPESECASDLPLEAVFAVFLRALPVSDLHVGQLQPRPFLQTAQIAEDEGCGGRDYRQRKAETKPLHAQLAGDARKIITDRTGSGVHD